jgi:hypothetical protein
MAPTDDERDDLIDDLEEQYPDLDREELEAIANSMIESESLDPSETVIDDLEDFIDAYDSWDGEFDSYDVETSPDYGNEE